MSIPPPPPVNTSHLPLPPHWSEHRAPTGQLYYYNAHTKESTFIRPPPLPTAFNAGITAPPKKKAKPVDKVPIPGTDWTRITNADGNVFYFHKESKRSVWTVPEEIKEQVENWERGKEEGEGDDEPEPEPELEEKVEEKPTKRKSRSSGATKARKKAKVEDYDEAVGTPPPSDLEDNEQDEEGGDEDAEQRALLEQMALEGEHEQADADMADVPTQAPAPAPAPTPALPALAIPEAKALFTTLLREKDINPLHPWDTSLPLLITDPRYLLLPSLSLRKETFEEYCRERMREIKAAKLVSSASSSHSHSGAVDKEREGYEKLLKEEVKSTRMTWSEFRKMWKKDRRFWGFGRDDREREKVFKNWVKELGEIKRASAKQAEENFVKMLVEQKNLITSDSVWKEVKKSMVDDPRYDAVGSSSLREELFGKYVKTLTPSGGGAKDSSTLEEGEADEEGYDDEQYSKEEAEKAKARAEKQAQALKERERRIREEKEKIAQTIDRTRVGTQREEAEGIFQSLLTDAVREASTTWEKELDHLSADPRFINSPLETRDKIRLFHVHVGRLREKYLASLHALFLAHSPGLDTAFSSLPISSIRASLPATKLKLSTSEIEDEYARWRRVRYMSAKTEFEEMLKENTFLDFWGRAGKSKIDSGVTGGREGTTEGMNVVVENDDLIGEENPDEEARDVREMAKGIDVEEVERVLKGDKRYRIFDHVPEQRMEWVKSYMERMAAPKLSVHTG